MNDHGHDFDYAPRERGHSDMWSYIEGLREDLSKAEYRIHELERIISAPAESDGDTNADHP